jgi:hypothetical protein
MNIRFVKKSLGSWTRRFCKGGFILEPCEENLNSTAVFQCSHKTPIRSICRVLTRSIIYKYPTNALRWLLCVTNKIHHTLKCVFGYLYFMEQNTKFNHSLNISSIAGNDTCWRARADHCSFPITYSFCAGFSNRNFDSVHPVVYMLRHI